jgi:hypothetical protein
LAASPSGDGGEEPHRPAVGRPKGILCAIGARQQLCRCLADSPQPFAEIGRQTFDGTGNTDAAATLSANGNIGNVTVQGTYVVDSDCTGSMMLNVLPFGNAVPVDFVIDDGGAELRAIITNAGVVESRVYRKQFPRDHRK